MEGLALDLGEQERQRLVAHLRRRGASVDEAEDLAQDALLRTHRARGSFLPGRPLWAWLRTIADRLLIDRVRQRRRRPGTVSLDAVAEPAAASGADASRAGLVDAVRAAAADLPTQERAAFALFYERGRSVARIARELGAPEGTVKSWLHRARRRVRTRLRTQAEEM